jgi:curli production assembly/transport component CsgF
MSGGVRLAAVAAGLFFAGSTAASAQQMVYTPINPSFGGNPFNSAHLLGIANAQNNFKDPKSTTSSSQQDIFARQLQSRLLSALSGQIVDAVFGPNAQQSGTVDFGGQTIAWNRDLENVTLTITNDDTGEVTTIVVPTIIDVTGG